MGDTTPSTPDGVATPYTPQPADPLVVLEHIASLIETTLGTARGELEAVGSLLSEAQRADSINKCTRFSSEPQVALYAQKDLRQDLVNGHDETDRRYFIHPGVCLLNTISRKRAHLLPVLRLLLWSYHRWLNCLPKTTCAYRSFETHCLTDTRCQFAGLFSR